MDNAKEDWLNTEVEAAQQVPAAYLHILLHHVEAFREGSVLNVSNAMT